MPCAAQTSKSLHASHLAAKSPLSARLPAPVGRCCRRHNCRFVVSAIGAVEKAQAEAKQRPEYIPGRIDDPNYVRIFDTTLRDGEQSPGVCTCTKPQCDLVNVVHRFRNSQHSFCRCYLDQQGKARYCQAAVQAWSRYHRSWISCSIAR